MTQDNQISPENSQPLKDHPLYKTALAQASAGEWNQAFQTFESLQTLYPDDPDLQKLLKEAQMRGTLSQLRPTHRKKRKSSSGLKRWGIGFLAVTVVVMAGYLAYAFWINPVFLQEWRIQQIIRLRKAADEAIATGDYGQARQSLQQLQEFLPKDPEAAETLHQIEQLEKVTQLYNDAKTLLQTEKWDQAIETLSELQTLDSPYRDTKQLLQLAREFKTLDKQFQTAEKSFADGNWATAIAQYKAIHQANLTFKYELIQKRLFESYLAYGRLLLAKSGGKPNQVAQALSQIDKALKIRPIDSEALNEHRLAETYLTALNTDVPDVRITLLQTLYNERSDTIQQDVAQLLYSALLERAETSLKTGQSDAALEDIQRAAKLPVADPSVAQEKLSNLLAESSP